MVYPAPMPASATRRDCVDQSRRVVKYLRSKERSIRFFFDRGALSGVLCFELDFATKVYRTIWLI